MSPNSEKHLSIRVDQDTHQIVISDPSGTLAALATLSQASIVLIKAIVNSTGHLIPILVEATAEAVTRILEKLTYKITEAIDRLGRALVREISDDFVCRMEEAERYPEAVKKGMQEAAAKRFIARMERHNVTGLTVEMLVAGW